MFFFSIYFTASDLPPVVGCRNCCDWFPSVWLQHRCHQCSSKGKCATLASQGPSGYIYPIDCTSYSDLTMRPPHRAPLVASPGQDVLLPWLGTGTTEWANYRGSVSVPKACSIRLPLRFLPRPVVLSDFSMP